MAMKYLRGILFFVLVTAFATSNAVTNRIMMLQGEWGQVSSLLLTLRNAKPI